MQALFGHRVKGRASSPASETADTKQVFSGFSSVVIKYLVFGIWLYVRRVGELRRGMAWGNLCGRVFI